MLRIQLKNKVLRVQQERSEAWATGHSMNHSQKLNLPLGRKRSSKLPPAPLTTQRPQSISVLSLRTGAIPLKEVTFVRNTSFLESYQRKATNTQRQSLLFIYMFDGTWENSSFFCMAYGKVRQRYCTFPSLVRSRQNRV